MLPLFLVGSLFQPMAHATGMHGAADPHAEPSVGTGVPWDLDIQQLHADAADEFAVPEPLLLALSYEASRWNVDLVSSWGGYGLFDLREPDDERFNYGPDVELAAQLLELSPDALIDDPVQSARGAAAILAYLAADDDGSLPAITDLGQWYDAVRAYSGKHEENLQHLYAEHIFDIIALGVTDHPGVELSPVLADLRHVSVPVPPPSTCDYSGCYQFVSASSSNYSNYSRSGSDIAYVVIHTVQGSYSGCISWFQNSAASVSAHYVVRSSDGQITQMVKEEDVAWHAGNWSYNEASVGIEHEGYVDYPDDYYTDAMYTASADLTADVIARTSASASRSSIIAHSEVPSATHTDPGSGWDWDYYMDLIGGGSGGTSTGDIVGVVADTDIYDTSKYLPGATVWIDETGESTTVESDGYYRFYDQALTSYTMYASMDGYEIGSCTKTLSSGTNWCSIALTPASGDTGGGDDGGGSDTGLTDSGGEPDETDSGGPGDDPGDGRTPGQMPGDTVPMNQLWGGGCASATGTGGALLSVLSLGLLAVRRED